MMVGENIHNAFVVVFKTLQEIEKLIGKCRTELDTKKYYMPAERFMRYSSDQTWEGWIYWSFILLFQRLDDGSVMENGWIDGPVYAVEINVDSDTCDVPKVYIAKMQFDRMKDWTKDVLHPIIHCFITQSMEIPGHLSGDSKKWKSRNMI